MDERTIESNFDDDAFDSKYFELIDKLLINNQNRYSFQATQILELRTIDVEVKSTKLRFRLTPTGCSYQTIKSGSNRSSDGWGRMGWGRASKRKALPGFFARAEALALLNLESE